MKFHVLTIFPHLVADYCAETILGRAQEQELISVHPIDIRDFAANKHRTVDDTPYGGGPGMVMKPEPIYGALESIGALSKKHHADDSTSVKKKTILLSPRGRQFDQRVAEEWSGYRELTLVCGRYEGVDQRVVDYMVDEEVSVGPYVLAGGELGALIIIESVARLLPGVLGNEASLQEETFGGIPVEYPQYTKPADFLGWQVPDILLSGDHKKIAEWRHHFYGRH